MEFEKALELVKKAVLKDTGKELSAVQETILNAAWNDETYEKIASDLNLSVSYIEKDLAHSLFRILKKEFSREIRKKNFKSEMIKIKVLLEETTTTNDNEEIKILKNRIVARDERINELSARVNDANQKIEKLESNITLLLKELDETGTKIPSLEILKNKLQNLNVSENLKICKNLESIVKLKQNSWAEEAGSYVLEKYPELTTTEGLINSQEKREEFYKDLKKYFTWISVGLSKARILPLEQVKINRVISEPLLYRDAFMFILNEKTIVLEAKEAEMLKSYLNKLVTFLY